MQLLHAWAVRRVGDDHETLVNHTHRGGSLAECLRDWRDVFPSLKFTELRARKAGAPVTTARLTRVSSYRRMPWVKAGARVTVCGERAGYIVDGNDSANFDVLLDGGGVVNCHPNDVTFRPEEERQ